MDDKKKLQFYELQRELILLMTERYNWDIPRIDSVLGEICRLFRLSRAESQFYESLRHEAMNDGENIVCYDNGRGGSVTADVRVVTRVSAVIIGRVYLPDDEEPLSEEEYDLVMLAMRTALSLLSLLRLQKVVAHLSFHDDSGFRNLRFFQQTLARLDKEGTLPTKTALHYNLRHFSLVNQEIGRKAGDIVMHNHYTGIQELIGESGTVCRLGGDNFLAVCDQACLEPLLDYLKETPVIYDTKTGARIMIAASAGIYQIPEKFRLNDANQIMDKIMPASLAARSGGKDRFIYYSPQLDKNKEKGMRVQQRFSEALRNEEFLVFYQPKIDISSGRLVGAEALCRWFHKEQLIQPRDFIPLLEETTEICQLDFYMLDHVCRDIRRWLDEKRDVVRISVNLSRKHMMDIDLLKNIIEIIDKYEVPHRYIEIELTETTTDVKFRDLKRVVSGLQNAGICTSVDDFGVGYSSLNLIREIPWNVIKIDRSFLPMDAGENNNTSRIMFKHVVAMTKELGLECITEGVETENQLALLRDNNCGFAQGFLFDRPLCITEFEKRLNGYIYNI